MEAKESPWIGKVQNSALFSIHITHMCFVPNTPQPYFHRPLQLRARIQLLSFAFFC